MAGRGVTVAQVGWLALGLAAAVPAAADKDKDKGPNVLAYLHSSTNENGEAPSTWGYNAVDGKPTTAWCTGGDDPKGQMLILGFSKQETITHISVIPGAVGGDGLDKSHARVSELEINNGQEKRTIVLQDDVKPMELELQPPMHAWKVALVIKDIRPAEGGKHSACLAEVTLRSGGITLTGENVARQVRGMARNKLALTGPWVDEPSAPERYLTLAMDGTFSWVFEPLMEGTPTKLQGEWDLANGRLLLKPKGAPKAIPLRMEREKVAGRKGTVDQLTLEGEGGHEKLPGNYQPNLMKAY